MREYGQIQCAFWQSADAQEWTDAGKLLAAYLMTGPHSNGLGCYRCPDGYVLADLGWSQERVSEGFAELSRNGFAYRFDGVVFMPGFLRWNKVANGNVASARMAEFDALPKGESKARVAVAILKYVKHLSNDHRTVLQRVAQTVSQTVSETVTQTETNPNQPNPILFPSPAAPETHGDELDAKRQRQAQRLAEVTDAALVTFNASKLVKPNGGALATVSEKVGRENRQRQVQRCIAVARQICAEDYQADHITDEFWRDYWAVAHADDFHAGRQRGGRGHENWTPDFEFLTRPATMLKLYDRAASEAAA